MLLRRVFRAAAQIPVELTHHGRYAYVLYQTAQDENSLDEVHADMNYMTELFSQSQDFNILVSNPGLKRRDVSACLEDLMETADFHDVTKKVVNMLVDNGRLKHLEDIASKYNEYYAMKDRKESVRVVSAEKLSAAQQKDVAQSLKEYDSDVQYELEFDQDPSILGGLQLYFPTAFMDLSLKSRLDKIKEELESLAP